jgi:hypothetical protein
VCMYVDLGRSAIVCMYVDLGRSAMCVWMLTWAGPLYVCVC